MEADDESEREGQLTFYDVVTGVCFRGWCLFVVVLLCSCGRGCDLFFRGLRGLLRARVVACPEPESDCHDGEVTGNQHRAGEICADADEPVGLHEKIEEETLVQMLEEVVQAAAETLNCAAQCHLILPTFALRLEGDSIYVIRHETAVRTRGIAKALLDHSSHNGLQPHLVTIIVIPHLLQIGPDAHLPTGNRYSRVEQI